MQPYVVLHGTPPLGNYTEEWQAILLYYCATFITPRVLHFSAFHVYIKGVGNHTGGYLEYDVENCDV